MPVSLAYSDVYLVPKYSTLRSRNDADVSVEFLGKRFTSPVMPANMTSVIDASIAQWLSQANHFYIYHRFGDTLAFVRNANVTNQNDWPKGWNTISISIGVQERDKVLLRQIIEEKLRVDYITIDVAHGHHVLVRDMIAFIKSLFLVSDRTVPKIIAGNVTTPDAVRDLTTWGADAAKVGIAGGAACRTRNVTGFHIPMFSCVKQCVEEGGPLMNGSVDPYGISLVPTRARIPIIADGGIKETGDIVKALVAGASMVMCGSLLAACKNAPGENIYEETSDVMCRLGSGVVISPPYGGQRRIKAKRYYGSASANQKKETRHIEGTVVEIPCNGLFYDEKYQEINEGLQSAVSYAGGRDLSAFSSVQWISVNK